MGPAPGHISEPRGLQLGRVGPATKRQSDSKRCSAPYQYLLRSSPAEADDDATRPLEPHPCPHGLDLRSRSQGLDRRALWIIHNEYGGEVWPTSRAPVVGCPLTHDLDISGVGAESASVCQSSSSRSSSSSRVRVTWTPRSFSKCSIRIRRARKFSMASSSSRSRSDVTRAFM
jgi:hypothetical protein